MLQQNTSFQQRMKILDMVEQPINAKIRVVANLCKYKYKNIFFRDRQMDLRKNANGIIFF